MTPNYNWIEDAVTSFPLPESHEEIDWTTRQEITIETEASVSEFSMIAEFFVASILFQNPRSDQLSFLIPNQKVMDQITQDISPFFQTTKGVHFNGSLLPFDLILDNLKEETIQFFYDLEASGRLNPIIASLFSPMTVQEPEPEFLSRTHLKIANKHMNSYKNQEFDQVLIFLKEYYLPQNNQIVLTPYNWVYDEHLHENKALQYFAAHFDHVILSVIDETKEITFLTLY